MIVILLASSAITLVVALGLNKHYETKLEKELEYLNSVQNEYQSQTELKLEEQNKQIEELNKQISAKKAKEAAQAASKASVAVSKPNVASNGGCEQYRPLVSQYGWNADVALSVMKAESGCNPNAISSTNDHGLFQLHAQPVYDPAQNVAIAYQKYAARGWQPWTVCTKGIVSCY